MSNRIDRSAYMAILLLIELAVAETHSNVDGVDTLCLEIDFVERVAADFEQRIQDAENKLSTLETEVKTFELAAACATADEDVLRFHALSAAAKKRATAARHDLDKKKNQLQESANVLRSRAAQLKAFAAMWPGKPSYSGATFESDTYSSATKGTAHRCCSISVATEQTTENTCAAELGTAPKSGAAAAEIDTLTYVKALADNKFKPPTIKVGIAAEGNVGSNLAGKTTDNQACADTNAGSKANLKAATDGVGIATYTPINNKPGPEKQFLKKKRRQ
uniref:Variant surface glycoprotein 1125.1569 n=1 Tax=Trypanosoma brucei TaxID=5691 RepID=A0A1J0R7A0_9TRYP|nr:variant surface glycoprotein 1125.1569 [Trypanosoma brucei]